MPSAKGGETGSSKRRSQRLGDRGVAAATLVALSDSVSQNRIIRFDLPICNDKENEPPTTHLKSKKVRHEYTEVPLEHCGQVPTGVSKAMISKALRRSSTVKPENLEAFIRDADESSQLGLLISTSKDYEAYPVTELSKVAETFDFNFKHEECSGTVTLWQRVYMDLKRDGGPSRRIWVYYDKGGRSFPVLQECRNNSIVAHSFAFGIKIWKKDPSWPNGRIPWWNATIRKTRGDVLLPMPAQGIANVLKPDNIPDLHDFAKWCVQNEHSTDCLVDKFGTTKASYITIDVEENSANQNGQQKGIKEIRHEYQMTLKTKAAKKNFSNEMAKLRLIFKRGHPAIKAFGSLVKNKFNWSMDDVVIDSCGLMYHTGPCPIGTPHKENTERRDPDTINEIHALVFLDGKPLSTLVYNGSVSNSELCQFFDIQSLDNIEITARQFITQNSDLFQSKGRLLSRMVPVDMGDGQSVARGSLWIWTGHDLHAPPPLAEGEFRLLAGFRARRCIGSNVAHPQPFPKYMVEQGYSVANVLFAIDPNDEIMSRSQKCMIMLQWAHFRPWLEFVDDDRFPALLAQLTRLVECFGTAEFCITSSQLSEQ